MDSALFDETAFILDRLSAEATYPEQAANVIDDIVAGWANEPGITIGAAQVRMQILWDRITQESAALRQQIDDGDSAEWVTKAERTLRIMGAVLDALEALLGIV